MAGIEILSGRNAVATEVDQIFALEIAHPPESVNCPAS
jgi:hypothetical protein